MNFQRLLSATTILFLLVLGSGTAQSEGADRNPSNAAQLAENSSILVAWLLPQYLTDTTIQGIDLCVRAAFDVSLWNANLTGTLSYLTRGEPSYDATPEDVLRVNYPNGRTIDFTISQVQGNITAGAEEFFNDAYNLSCHIVEDGTVDLSIRSSNQIDRNATQVNGTIAHMGELFDVDAGSESEIYFESSYGGSEYRNQTSLIGRAESEGMALEINDNYFFHMVTFEGESASVNHRTVNGRWQTEDGTYAFDNVVLNRSFKDGEPSRTDTEWRTHGNIMRGNSQWGTVSGALAGEFFEIKAFLPGGEELLEAIPLTAAAASSARDVAEDRTAETVGRRDEGESLLDSDLDKRSQLAIQLYQEIGLSEDSAFEMVQNLGVSDEVMIPLTVVVARNYLQQGEFDNALHLVDDTLVAIADSDMNESKAALLREAGNAHYYLGNMSTALSHFEQALVYYEQVGGLEGQAVSLASRGLVYEGLADYELALKAYLSALAIFSQIEKNAEQSPDEPLPESLALFRLPFNLGTIYNNLGSLYQTLGEPEQSEESYLRALTYNRQSGTKRGEATVLHNLGRLYLDLERYDDSQDALQAALLLAEESFDQIAEGHVLNTLGEWYASRGEYRRALLHYNDAIRLFERLDAKSALPGILNNIGMVQFNRRQYGMARGAFQEALSLYEADGFLLDQAIVLSNLGLIAERQRNMEEALQLYRDSIDLIESIQGNLRIDDVKSLFLANVNHLYSHLIERLWDEEEYIEAFAYAERARSRTLLAQLANSSISLSARPDESQENEAERLRQKILQQQSALAAERAKPFDQQDSDRLSELQIALAGDRKAYTRLLTRLKVTNPQYASLVAVDTLPLEALQAEYLDGNTALIEYYVLADRTLAWVIDSESVSAVELDISRNDLVRQVDFLRALIQSEDFDQELAADLYRRIVTPVVGHVSRDNVIIVAHDVLHYLPFAALWDGEQEKYLIELKSIQFAPSASVIQFLQKDEDQEIGSLLVLSNPGNDLPHADVEAVAIASLYDTRPFSRTHATESLLIRSASQVDVLHLAAHGVYDSVNPLFSRIELAADDEHDGQLEVHEIYQLDLDATELVVLSACETALGNLSSGDEIVGLTRAFLYAGTPELVTSLWTVSDESTAYLMGRLHAYLKDGLDTASALRQAQIDTINEYPDPYDWAAFVLHSGL